MGRKLTALMLSFACILSVFSASHIVQARVIHEVDLEDYIMKEMSAANILGMGISIVSGDKELYCAAYGTAHKTESDYVLGELSKSFTAAGIMRMAEDGDLALEDKVSDYLPKYKSMSDVTIQELLYQTSGLTFEQTMSKLEVTEKRGTFQESFANYNLLGEIIEEVSGMTYEEYISDNILDPLNMTSTYSLRTGSDESEKLLTGYQYYFGFPVASNHEYAEEDDWIQVPSGFLISDIKDMGKYLQMYLKEGGDVLSKDSVHRMLYDGVNVPSDGLWSGNLFDGSAKYSMGWVEKELKGQPVLYHAGRVENFTSLMVLLPESDLGITILFNSMDCLVGQKLMQTLEEGIISIEAGETPVKISSRDYLLRHGMIDVIMLVVLIAAWLPVLLMGGWIRRRKKQFLSVPELVIDILIQVVLPTVMLIVLKGAKQEIVLKRFTPDIYYVAIGVIVSLYLGGLIKLIAGVVMKSIGSKKPFWDKGKKADAEEEKPLEDKNQETAEKTEKLPEKESVEKTVQKKNQNHSARKSSGAKSKKKRKKR